MDCGRRWGKSYFGEIRIVPLALEGYPVGWFAPSYKYLTEVWADLLRILTPVFRGRPNKQERRIELITGGSVEMWSLEDDDAGRSRKYRHVVIDEAAKVANLEATWNEAIRPTLTDFGGSADFLSTPKGRNFFWKAYEWGRSSDPQHREWASWMMPTAMNPTIPNLRAELAAAKAQLPERVYQQEYEAQFLEDAGGVFRGVTAAVDKGRAANDSPIPGVSYALGVDLAKHEDFTVLTVADQAGRQAYFERFNRVAWERALQRVADVSGMYNRATVYLDTTGIGDPLYEQLRSIPGVGPIVPVVFTNASKEALVNNLAMRIEGGTCRLMDVPTQVAELIAYEYELTPSRNVRMQAPEGMWDDCVISLALAYWGLKEKRKLIIV